MINSSSSSSALPGCRRRSNNAAHRICDRYCPSIRLEARDVLNMEMMPATEILISVDLQHVAPAV